MSIFNSLGSNYDLEFALRSLLAKGKEDDNMNLKKFLEDKYGGKAVITYKGRDALRLALKIINKPKDYSVGICGFTCIAVYEAILKEGYKIEYLDLPAGKAGIENDSLNFSFETLVSSYKKNPKLKILFIQNTLGYPCDLDRILQFCKEKDIVLVEDLAHSVGTKYDNGYEAGTVGDFSVHSFSQDKMIDGISGGALIVKSSKFKIQSSELINVSFAQQNKDRLYPLFTFLIRKTYGIGIGKLLHFFLKKADLLSKPVENSINGDLHSLPFSYCRLIFRELLNLNKNLEHRKKIAAIYSKNLNGIFVSKKILSQIQLSSNLRFPIFVNNRLDLVRFLKKHGIYISDIWYDAPIAPKKYLNKTNYKKGNCPNAELVSEQILNLPTHKNVSESKAKHIAQKINLWLKLQ